ncbi:hypothetical protein Ddc_12006 [Ditylenchus destructor]|nr:hypothetical protein Ddc_12006 [Ditylenchus destructor]
MIDDIIKRDFASKPLRLIDEDIMPYISRSKNNEFLLGIWQRYNKCFVPSVPGWQDCMKNHESDRQPCQHHSYPTHEMRPFLAKHLRYRNVEILITENDSCLPSYSPEQIAVLESICHIWSGQKLSILDTDYGDKDHNIDNLERIFGSSAILQCRPLRHWKVYCTCETVATSLLASGIYLSSNLYSLHSIFFSCLRITDLLNLVHYKTEYPHSNTIFVLYGGQMSGEAACNAWCVENIGVFRKIKEEFLTSSVPCRLQVLFELDVHDVWDTQESPTKDLEFRLENSCTKEVLQLKYITMKESVEKFDVFFSYDGLAHDEELMVFCLERFPV